MKKFIIAAIALIYIFLGVNMPFATANTWTSKIDFGGLEGIARHAAVGFSIGSKGYIGTGWDTDLDLKKDFWEYDSDANTWTQKADFGGGNRSHAVGFSISSKGYIGTGYDGSSECNDFWEYNPSTNEWTKMEAFGGLARESAVGFSIGSKGGSKGYIGTGWDGSSSVYSDFWEYDPGTDTWTSKAELKENLVTWPSYGAVGFSIGTKGYIGTGGNDYYDDSFWEYDSDANTWTQKAAFEGGARDSAVGFSMGSKGYIGTGYDGSSEYSDLWEYDPALDTWTAKAAFGGTARDSAVGFSISSKGYIGTGFDGLSDYKDFWEYDPNDTIPDQFTFTEQTNVALSTTVTSNTITIAGIDAAATISITGGTYSINGGTYTSDSGTVSNGDTVTVQQTSSGSYSTTTDATLTIGGVSGTFSVTTQAESASDSVVAGGCFIATAAFGSPLAGQVKILRQFRDRYLLTNDLGRKFVAWYYRDGPVAASYIEDKPLAKAAVRAVLYPLIGFSLLLISGYLPFVIIGLLFPALLFFRFRSKKLNAK